MKRYIQTSNSIKSTYLGIEYIVSRSKNNKGYVYVIPEAKSIKGFKASGFDFDKEKVIEKAKNCIEQFIDYAISNLIHFTSINLEACPQCGIADYYDPNSKVCAYCGYYEDLN